MDDITMQGMLTTSREAIVAGCYCSCGCGCTCLCLCSGSTFKNSDYNALLNNENQNRLQSRWYTSGLNLQT